MSPKRFPMPNEAASFKNLLILGANGQVGRALSQTFAAFQPILASRNEVDFSNTDACIRFLNQTQPSLILNAAAYTQVDLAEKEPELCKRINTDTPGAIAKWCAETGASLVHYSTDYVFSGEGSIPWKETDPTRPLNTYGQTKLEGEKQIVESGCDFLIFRTSWVYDAYGKNFLKTMLKLGKERELLKIVNDQSGAPTYAPALAQATQQILTAAIHQEPFHSGLYHLCNSGETTWYGFAKSIFDLAKANGLPLRIKDLVPISTQEYPTPAVRPKNSRLDTTQVFRTFQVKLPDWHDSLKTCMEVIRESSLN